MTSRWWVEGRTVWSVGGGSGSGRPGLPSHWEFFNFFGRHIVRIAGTRRWDSTKICVKGCKHTDVELQPEAATRATGCRKFVENRMFNANFGFVVSKIAKFEEFLAKFALFKTKYQAWTAPTRATGCRKFVENKMFSANFGFVVSKIAKFEVFLAEFASFKTKYQVNDRGDRPLSTAKVLNILSFPDETGKFSRPCGFFPDGGQGPHPHLPSPLFQRR